jgi:hypothetical protein
MISEKFSRTSQSQREVELELEIGKLKIAFHTFCFSSLKTYHLNKGSKDKRLLPLFLISKLGHAPSFVSVLMHYAFYSSFKNLLR